MASAFESGIDACVVWPNGRVYFFKGDSYLRFDIASDRVDQDPRPILGSWSGWPTSWAGGIQGAIAADSHRAYFFRGGDYLRYDIAADRVDQDPRPIASSWPGWPAAWSDGIDGCVNWGNGLVYFFKGANFLRYDLKQDRVTRDPTPIASAWGNWPFPWNARMNGGGVWPNGTAFLFSGAQYIRYSVAADAAAGPPASIKDNWIGWPGYVAPDPNKPAPGVYTFKAKSNGCYLKREAAHYIANTTGVGKQEKFTLRAPHDKTYGCYITDCEGHWLTYEWDIAPLIDTNEVLRPKDRQHYYSHFELEYRNGLYAIKQPEVGKYVTVEPSGYIAFNRSSPQDWEFFTMTKVG